MLGIAPKNEPIHNNWKHAFIITLFNVLLSSPSKVEMYSCLESVWTSYIQVNLHTTAYCQIYTLWIGLELGSAPTKGRTSSTF